MAVIGAVAMLPATAGAHPEECGASTLASMPSASPFDSWLEGSEGCISQAARQGLDDSDAQLAVGESAGTGNLKLVSSTPKAPPFESTGDFNSDIAFEDGYAYQGNYDGIQIWDVRKGDSPTLVAAIHCPGSQNDVSVYNGLLFTSTDSSRNKAECEGNVSQSATIKDSWEGIRVFDVSDPTAPEYVTAVETDCGSHTHTLLPEADRALLYVSSYRPSASFPDCQPPHDKISIVEVPLAAPQDASVIGEPVLFPDGGFPGIPGQTSSTSGCHDITVYQEIDLAAGACMGEGAMIDISDPENPEVISSVTDPNFAFWHSATISNDGEKVLFTDELGGGGGPTCNETIGPERGADAIYDISDPANPQFMSYFKIPRTNSNTENCVAHNGNLIPNKKGRDILVQSWYQGGVSVVDWTNGSNPQEIAWFDRGPIDEDELVVGGFWSSYYYNGYIYGSEIQRGWDVFKLTDPRIAASRAFKSGTVNAQTQFEYDQPGWGRGRG